MDDSKTVLLDEKVELEKKLRSLNAFMQIPTFNDIHEVQRTLLKVQAKAMATYLECLNERITWLTNEVE